MYQLEKKEVLVWRKTEKRPKVWICFLEVSVFCELKTKKSKMVTIGGGKKLFVTF